MTQKHTPTPWEAVKNSVYWEIQANECGFGCVADTCASSASAPEFGRSLELGAANAAHIVRCVNAHDDLVSALQDLLIILAEPKLENFEARLKSHVKQAENALAKAKGV